MLVNQITKDREVQFSVGYKFIRYGKNKRKDVETIVDILTVTNSAGVIVQVEYVVAHDFFGQTVTDTVNAVTIARSEQV